MRAEIDSFSLRRAGSHAMKRFTGYDRGQVDRAWGLHSQEDSVLMFRTLMHAHTFRLFPLAFLLVAGSDNSPALEASLYGPWRGDFLVSSQKLPVEIVFAPDGTMKISDGEVRYGNFSSSADRIDLVITSGEEKTSAHIRVTRLTENNLTGKFNIEGEPPELSATIELSRIDKPAAGPAQRKAGQCSIPDLPQSLKSVLAHYKVTCPIQVPSPLGTKEGERLADIFRAILNEVLKPDFSVMYNGNGKFAVRGDHSSMPEVEQVLKPLLANPDAVSLGDSRSGCPFELGIRCALDLRGFNEVKPQFRNGDSIDFHKVWETAVHVALAAHLNLLQPTVTPPFKASTGLVPKVVGPDGLIYERVSLSVADAYPESKAKTGKYVRIDVRSEIWRKPSFAAKRAFKVEDECSSITGDVFNITCTARPLIESILRQVAEFGGVL
jgi:hypothetical protein